MGREVRYRLNVNLTIQREERYDPERDHWQPTQDRLGVEESVNLGSMDFLGITRVLAQLHDAVTQIKATPQVDETGPAVADSTP